jgi:hemerythrin
LSTFDFLVSSNPFEETRVMQQTIWLPEISLGAPALDHLHQDFIGRLKNTSSVPDSGFCAQYLTLTECLEQMFRQEDQWMDAIDFAGVKAHREQHARVLGALHNMRCVVMQGDVALGRRVVDMLLPHWLAFHFATMDAALAFALQIMQTEQAPADACTITF